jgi:hypothetical protein
VDTEVLNLLLGELEQLQTGFYWIAGNHDLIYHSLDLMSKSTIYALKNLKNCAPAPYYLSENDYYRAFHFGERILMLEIMFIHQLVTKEYNLIIEKNGGICAKNLSLKFPDAKWIFTGDNHQSFVYKSPKNQIIANPGCLNRQTADMKNYQPVCYFVDIEIQKIEEIKIPDEQEMVTDDYLVESKYRENRISAFAEKIQSKIEISLSFRDNLREKLKDTSILGSTKKKIIEICEKCGLFL